MYFKTDIKNNKYFIVNIIMDNDHPAACMIKKFGKV